MKLNRNKKILIGLMCLGVGFVLYKYFGNVVEGFEKINDKGLGPQAQIIINGHNQIERIYNGGPAIPATQPIAEVLNTDGSIKTPYKYGTLAQPAVPALPIKDKNIIKKALRNILQEIKS